MPALLAVPLHIKPLHCVAFIQLAFVCVHTWVRADPELGQKGDVHQGRQLQRVYRWPNPLSVWCLYLRVADQHIEIFNHN